MGAELDGPVDPAAVADGAWAALEAEVTASSSAVVVQPTNMNMATATVAAKSDARADIGIGNPPLDHPHRHMVTGEHQRRIAEP